MSQSSKHRDVRLSGSQDSLIARQKSAEGIVVVDAMRSTMKARTAGAVIRNFHLVSAMRPNQQLMLSFATPEAGEACAPRSQGVEALAAREVTEHPVMSNDTLMEIICSDDNVQQAMRRVRPNKGVPGIDGMTVYELGSHWGRHGSQIVNRLKSGRYHPPSGSSRGDSQAGPVACQPRSRAASGVADKLVDEVGAAQPSANMSRDEHITCRTAVYGPVRTVVWEGPGRKARPNPDPGVAATR